MSRLQCDASHRCSLQALLDVRCSMGVHKTMLKCMHGCSIASWITLSVILTSCSTFPVQQYLLTCAHMLPYACSMAVNTQKKYHPSLCQAPKQHQPWPCRSLGWSWRSSTRLRQAPAVRRHPSQGHPALLHLGMQ